MDFKASIVVLPVHHPNNYDIIVFTDFVLNKVLKLHQALLHLWLGLIKYANEWGDCLRIVFQSFYQDKPLPVCT